MLFWHFEHSISEIKFYLLCVVSETLWYLFYSTDMFEVQIRNIQFRELNFRYRNVDKSFYFLGPLHLHNTNNPMTFKDWNCDGWGNTSLYWVYLLRVLLHCDIVNEWLKTLYFKNISHLYIAIYSNKKLVLFELSVFYTDTYWLVTGVKRVAVFDRYGF